MDDARNEHMDFLCSKLLRRFPLYEYRAGTEGGWRLSVALAGGGEKVWGLLKQIFPLGQLLDTTLDVTIYSPTAEADLEALRQAVPELGRFLRVGDEAPKVDWLLGSLRIIQTDHWQNVNDWKQHQYVLICNEAEDAALAGICGDGRLVACVRGDDLAVVSPRNACICGKSEAEDEAELARMKEVGYHLHYVYQKFTDPRASREEIRSNYEESYNHIATLGNVRHIRCKMACAGVKEPDLTGKSAAEFARLLREDPAKLDQLAYLEHKRWVMDRVFNGYKLQDDVRMIYQHEGDKGHSEDERWHVGLVPSAPGRRMNFDDWQTDETNCRSELDALERLSLEVHRVCREIAQQRVTDLLTSDIPNLENLVGKAVQSKERDTALRCVAHMRIAIEHMRQKKRIAFSRYQKHRYKLVQILNDQQKKAHGISQSLEKIRYMDEMLWPLKEYIFNKDYKGQDYLMVEHIPYALTWREEITLVKFLGEQSDGQFSPWQMEPERVIYVGFADTEEDAEEMLSQTQRIGQFLEHSCNPVESCFHILAQEGALSPEIQSKLQARNVAVLAVESRRPEVILDVLSRVLAGSRVDYMDVTGGSPVLVTAAVDYVRKHPEVGLLYVRDGHVRSILGADVLEYAAPRKGISVLEMFKQAGAARIHSEGAGFQNMSKVYQQLWKISRCTDSWSDSSYVGIWHMFCCFLNDAYFKDGQRFAPQTEEKAASKQKKKMTIPLKKLNAREPLVSMELCLSADHLLRLRPLIQSLEAMGYVEDVRYEQHVGNQWNASLAAHGQDAMEILSKALQKLIQEMGEHPSSLYSFEVKNDSDGHFQVDFKEMRVREAAIPEEYQKDFQDLLEKLADHRIIYGLDRAALPEKCTMSISSPEILSALTNSGKVLEYYLYNSALQEGMFDDVDLSWEFYHNAGRGSVHNELDVICTKGTTSLFISAKNVGKNTADSSFRNAACYEVSVLADRFGLNAKKVLAAPSVAQFEKGKRSSAVRHAMEREVYLLGDACFRPGKIGKVLDNIARGEKKWCEFLLEDEAAAE